MKDYQAYLFDWDGTLAQTLEEWLGILKSAYSAYGIDLDDKTIISGFGNWRAVIDFGLAEEHYAEYKQDIEQKSHIALSKAPLYEGAFDVLHRLKHQGKSIALLTSSYRRTIEAVLKHHRLDNMFDVVITGDDVTRYKPDPQCIMAAMSQLKLNPEDVVMLGDSDKDMGAAQNAGVDSILYYPETHHIFYDVDELKKYNPTHTISKWSEL